MFGRSIRGLHIAETLRGGLKLAVPLFEFGLAEPCLADFLQQAAQPGLLTGGVGAQPFDIVGQGPARSLRLALERCEFGLRLVMRGLESGYPLFKPGPGFF